MQPKGLYDANKIRQCNQMRAAGYKVATIAEVLSMTLEAVRLATYDSAAAVINREQAAAKALRREQAKAESLPRVEVTPWMIMQNQRRAARIVAAQMIAEGYRPERVRDFFARWL